MSPLLHPLLQSVGLAVPEGLADGEVAAVSCDSRRVGPGTLFVGLPGQTVDGGSFWPAALAAGAVAAVISPAAAAAAPPAPGEAVLVATEPLATVAGELAAAFWRHPSRRLALIGVTGTNGKTTITHLIEHLAAACGRPSALFGTLVNRWPGLSQTAHHTTPFADELQTLLAEAAQAGASVAAIEVSSHALDQGRVAGCDFAGAVFSNLTQDHLDYHPSMEAYFEAKALLFAAPLLRTGEDPQVVVNVDDPWGQRLAERLGRQCWRSSLLASESGEAELRMAELSFSSSGVSGRLITPKGEGRFVSPLLGRFNLMNLLQAVGALQQQGLPLEPLLAAVARFAGVPGRMERVTAGPGSTASVPTVLVDYAHTPDGLENALKASRPFAAGRLICVFGCGGDRDRGKRPQMGAIAAALADQVVVTSDNPRTEDPQQILDDVVAGIPDGTDLLVEGDRAAAIAQAVAAAQPEDLLLIAGKGHEDYQILGTTRIHFDDREEAEKALRGRAAALAS
ncbi:UDP-N-acetylmuramoyl-L-alanyl-D-glutamate--2,6-diaminopimelate ligase [Cyanobium sp. Morenito 9A2]|uniref:UDP-N-acetylmuramoyl-L-alanyl-D-glutamate--2, 6-diaminopimelate ligase n=1 Tax=Cyanobium sp. Morenito 9A2 TaxID=2823718 RepID=UPI0020CC0099|nr:UDP-N-acetylmuramoyl-L-alanyl-D-glutamate--2,6-diaminopimelate ligase [Cyanobium sp. Morenito 9A2]MCP9848243.1 UDP-N-acetylmuramoyl-L-alanyl-D-glutamate--2,6-diaminopimelate ligase [Cyanobium sp. Morenito 9A2]